MLSLKEDTNPILSRVQNNTGEEGEERMWEPEDP